MQIIQNKALLLTTKKADQITALIPKSKVLERRGDIARVLVNWDHEECQVLRNLNIKNVPHPIIGKYKWPGMYRPFNHQITTAAFAASNKRCYILNEMGTGKSMSVGWAADYLMTHGFIKKALILCPLSIMESAWQSDLFKSVMHRTVGIAYGSREVRAKVIQGNYDFVIMNHDGIKLMQDELIAAKFDLVIIDELTAFKTATSDRSKALHKIINPATWVWGMTGSPAAQSPVEAYGLAKAVKPDSVNFHFGKFRDMVMRKITQFKWVPKANAKETVHALLQPAIRYTKEECLDLPSIMYTTRDVPLTKQQDKYYNMIRQKMVIEAAGSQITAVNAATLMNKLLQISAGNAYDADKEVIEFDISNRYAELLDLVQQTENKVIVFVPFKHVIERLTDLLKKDGISSEFINGDVGLAKRTEIFKAFQTEDDPKVIIIQPQAAAHGVTLTRADVVVWWGPISSTETYVQANARAHRAGQKNKVTVVHLQGSPVEKRVFKMLENNIDVHQSIVELYKQELLTK